MNEYANPGFNRLKNGQFLHNHNLINGKATYISLDRKVGIWWDKNSKIWVITDRHWMIAGTNWTETYWSINHSQNIFETAPH